MTEAIVVALISGSVTLIGTVATILISSNKTHEKITTDLAVIDERISNLKQSVDSHNNFAKRMPVVEEQIKVINHRIDDLEEFQKSEQKKTEGRECSHEERQKR